MMGLHVLIIKTAVLVNVLLEPVRLALIQEILHVQQIFSAVPEHAI